MPKGQAPTKRIERPDWGVGDDGILRMLGLPIVGRTKATSDGMAGPAWKGVVGPQIKPRKKKRRSTIAEGG